MNAVGRITPEELAARGWEGVSRCRCDTEEGYVACPPDFCDAQALLDILRQIGESAPPIANATPGYIKFKHELDAIIGKVVP